MKTESGLVDPNRDRSESVVTAVKKRDRRLSAVAALHGNPTRGFCSIAFRLEAIDDGFRSFPTVAAGGGSGGGRGHGEADGGLDMEEPSLLQCHQRAGARPPR